MCEELKKDYAVKEQTAQPSEFDAFSKFCERCGANLAAQEKFCHNCGYPVNFHKKTLPQAKKKQGTKKFVLDIVKKSLVLSMAIFILISVFLPIVKAEVEVFDEKIKIKYSSIDGIGMFVNSCFSLDEDELNDELAEAMDNWGKYEDDWEEGEALDKLEGFVKRIKTVQLRSEEVTVTAGGVLVVILSIVQILLSILLAVFAVLSFVSVFTRRTKFSGLSFLLLGLNAVVIFTNAFALKNEFKLHVLQIKIAAAPIWILILVTCIAIAFAMLRLLVDKEKIRIGTIVKHSLGLIFAFALLISAFAPVVSTKIKTTFSNADSEKRATSTLDSSLFYSFDWSDEYKEAVEEMEDLAFRKRYEIARSYFSDFSLYSKLEFEKGEAKVENQNMYSWLLLAWGAYEYSEAFVIGGIVMIGIVFCALLLIIYALYEFAIGIRINLAISYIVKTIAILLAIAILVLTIVTSVIVNNNSEIVDLIIYETTIAYGPILTLIFAVAAVCVPPAISKKKLRRDLDFNQKSYDLEEA